MDLITGDGTLQNTIGLLTVPKVSSKKNFGKDATSSSSVPGCHPSNSLSDRTFNADGGNSVITT